MARPSIHCLSQCKGESWRLHVVVNTHPCYSVCGEIKEHISYVFTHLWGQRTYISGFPHWSMLTMFSACFARVISGRFNIVCVLSMIKYFSMVWSRRAVQSCEMSMHHHDPSGVSYFLHLCAILPSMDQICGDFFIPVFFSLFVCFHKSLVTVILVIVCILWFIFLCQRLFKGKVSDIIVWYHRFFCFLNWNCSE